MNSASISTFGLHATVAMAFSILVLGCDKPSSSGGSATKPATAPTTTTTPPAREVTFVVIDPSTKGPNLTSANDLKSKPIFAALARAHSACGLNASGFQDAMRSLQDTAMGSDFAAIIRTYVGAARLCHDAKVKPSRYSSSAQSAHQQTSTISLSGSASAAVTPPTVVAVFKLGGTYSKAERDETKIEEVIDYEQNWAVSQADRDAIQHLEDKAYEATITILKNAGFTKIKRSDLIGKWAWQWEDNGPIHFTLNGDTSMTAELFPAKTDKTMIANWGKGDWTFDKGRLVITMRRAGNKYMPGTLEWKEVWIDNRIEEASEDELLLRNGDRLRRVLGE